MVATYRSYWACWTQLGAVRWQPTGLMGLVGPSLGLYVGNLQVLWGLLDPAWGCMLANYMCHGACWTQLGTVCWQPTGLMRLVGPSLELYVGSLQVSGGLLYPAWGRILATYRSYEACWTQLGAVCWQPTGLMGLVGPSLGLHVGNLQVLWGLLDPAWGCMFATYRSYGACCTQLGAVCWYLPLIPKGFFLSCLWYLDQDAHTAAEIVAHRFFLARKQPSFDLAENHCTTHGSCTLPTYMSWTQFGAVCWQPRSYGACWTQLGGVCWQPTGLMELVSLGLYVGNLQVLWGLLDPA